MIIRLREKLIYCSIWLAFELGARRIPWFFRALDHSNYAQFALHLLYARLLAQEGRFELAAAEYNRCLQRRPGDRQIALELRKLLHALSMAGQGELIQQILQTRKNREPLSESGADEFIVRPAAADENKKPGSPTENKKSRTTITAAFLSFISRLLSYRSSPAAGDQEQFGEEIFAGRRAHAAYAINAAAPTARAASPAGVLPRGRKPDAIAVRISDAFVNAVEIIHSTFVFMLKKDYAVRKAGIFMTATRSFLLILAHVYMWDLLGRRFPSGIANYWWVVGGFAGWILVQSGFTKSHTKEYLNQWHYRNRIPFGAILIYDMIFEVCSTMFGASLSFVVLYMLNQRRFIDSSVDIDFVSLSGLLPLAYLTGFSIGSILDAIGDTFNINASFLHLAMWPIFISSGVYQAFQEAPTAAKDVMVFNPVLPILEFSRRAYDPQYSVEGLTLLYPIGFSMLGLFIYIWSALLKSQKGLKVSQAR